MTEYTYTVDKPVLHQLQQEIDDAGVAISGLTLRGDTDLTVTTASDLSTEDKTALDNVVASHSPVIQIPYRIWSYSVEDRDPTDDPRGLNFKTGLHTRLHPVYDFVAGELQKVEYYATATPNAQGTVDYSDLVCDVSFTYTRDAGGFAQYRVATRRWFLADGTPGPHVKVQVKYYTPQTSMKEGKRRRENIVDNAMMTVVGMLQATNPTTDIEVLLQWGRDLASEYSAQISTYIRESNRDIVTELGKNLPAYPWLDTIVDAQGTTIRDYLINELDI